MKKEAKRPRDANQLAKFIVDVATGEREEATVEVDPITAFTQANGRKGGASRATALSPARRQEIAQKAARARWDKKKLKA